MKHDVYKNIQNTVATQYPTSLVSAKTLSFYLSEATDHLEYRGALNWLRIPECAIANSA